MMSKASLSALVLLLAGAAASASAGDLARRIGESSRDGATWIGWTVPSTVSGRMCCGNWREGRSTTSRCSLKDEDVSWFRNDSEVTAHSTARVWVRVERGEIDRIKAVSLDCDLDTSGVRFSLFEDVEPAESVAMLAALLDEPDQGLRENALSSIAIHATPAADELLERLLDRGTDEIRPKAAFWLASERGARGAQAVIDRFRAEQEADVRQELTFALFVAARDFADQTLIQAARRDPSAEVRKQALFWIAQRAGEKATATLERTLEDDPQSEVRQHAVFAISQLPPERGVPLLIGLAREHRDPGVRRQAIFWLGQIDDPRATDFLISLVE